jgi:hypothetical protein
VDGRHRLGLERPSAADPLNRPPRYSRRARANADGQLDTTRAEPPRVGHRSSTTSDTASGGLTNVRTSTARARLDASTPFLLDDGIVSTGLGTLGTGLQAGLPGDGFVLVGADGNQVWQGDYPST